MFRSAVIRWLWRVYTVHLTASGRWFFWPSVLFTGYTAGTLEHHAYVPFCYSCGLWGFAFGSSLIARPKGHLTAGHPERVCAGEILRIDCEVTNGSRLPNWDWRIVPHRLPEGLDAIPDHGINVPDLKRGEKTRVRVGLLCKSRGLQTWKGFRIETDFPFGLVRTARTFEASHAVLVYPSFHPLTRFPLPTGRRHNPGGVALVSKLGESTEFAGNREYREGDNIRDMDWRATARLQRPIVREYREEFFLRVAVVLDTHVPPAKKNIWTGISSKERTAHDQRLEEFERAVSLSAAIGDFLARQEYLVDIFAAGPNLYHLTAGRGLAYLDQILDILACVKESNTEPFQTIEPELKENLSKISTVIAIFLDWNETRRDFLVNLQRVGVAIKPVIVRDGPCTLDPAADAGLFGEPIKVIGKAEFERGVEQL